MGKIEGQLIRQSLNARLPLPDRIANAPQLFPGNERYYDAFCQLSTCRNQGAIPWTAINDYANRMKFDDERYDDLLYFVREMDVVYLAHQEKVTKAGTDGKPKGSG